MADDPYARIAELEAELRRRDADLQEARAEIERRGHALTEALDQQTATSDLLRVIASSPIDAGPVLDAVARSAMRLSNSGSATIVVRDGDMGRIAATAG